MSASKQFVVTGIETYPYFRAAVHKAEEAFQKQPELYEAPLINNLPNRSSFQSCLDENNHPKSNDEAKKHRTSPYLYVESTGNSLGDLQR